MRLIFLVLSLLLPCLAASANPAAPPGLAPAFTAAELPAIGYVTNFRPAPGGGEGIAGCTGTLISARHVLTAAHCVADVADVTQIHVTFGWRNGPPLWRGHAVAMDLPQGYLRGDFNMDTARTDIALLTLPRPVPGHLVAPIPLGTTSLDASYAIWGYRRGTPTILAGHAVCRAHALDRVLLRSDCTVESGFSGAPLLRMTDDGPVVAAVVVATLDAGGGSARSLAVRVPPELRR